MVQYRTQSDIGMHGEPSHRFNNIRFFLSTEDHYQKLMCCEGVHEHSVGKLIRRRVRTCPGTVYGSVSATCKDEYQYRLRTMYWRRGQTCTGTIYGRVLTPRSEVYWPCVPVSLRCVRTRTATVYGCFLALCTDYCLAKY
jgi:hypothetical protein